MKYLILLCLVASSATAQDLLNDPPVPVEFMWLQWDRQDGKLWFEWQTASELNNDYFELERSSNAVVWEFVMRVHGSGTSKSINKYRVSCVCPGRQYYRLSQTDYDGTHEILIITVVPEEESYGVRYYDLQGRPVGPDTPGVLLQIIHTDRRVIMKKIINERH